MPHPFPENSCYRIQSKNGKQVIVYLAHDSADIHITVGEREVTFTSLSLGKAVTVIELPFRVHLCYRDN